MTADREALRRALSLVLLQHDGCGGDCDEEQAIRVMAVTEHDPGCPATAATCDACTREGMLVFADRALTALEPLIAAREAAAREEERERISQQMSDPAHLPDCMMPDGAEPCEGYRELAAQHAGALAHIVRLETAVAEEREACAKVADEHARAARRIVEKDDDRSLVFYGAEREAIDIAAAIRARSES